VVTRIVEWNFGKFLSLMFGERKKFDVGYSCLDNDICLLVRSGNRPISALGENGKGQSAAASRRGASSVAVAHQIRRGRLPNVAFMT
jgi:hypothetical protein